MVGECNGKDNLWRRNEYIKIIQNARMLSNQEHVLLAHQWTLGGGGGGGGTGQYNLRNVLYVHMYKM